MLRLRPAIKDDAHFIWECRNDPEARRFSATTTEIPYGEHCLWFVERLRDPSCQFWIAELSDHGPVGYGRLQETTISVVVHPVLRRLGFGRELIRLTTETALTNGTTNVIAWIRPENEASRRAFGAAGYQYQETILKDAVTLERWEATR